jgi:hypothetical protein
MTHDHASKVDPDRPPVPSRSRTAAQGAGTLLAGIGPLGLQGLVGNRAVAKMMQGRPRTSAAVSRYLSGEHAQFGARAGETERTFNIKGVVLTYGEMIAMADFFPSQAAVRTAPKDRLEKLLDLIRFEKSNGPGSVTEEQWTEAAGEDYLKLATKNDPHFAPSAKDQSFESSSENHKSAWFKEHKSALTMAYKNMKATALEVNAFGDHYLTDAFSAGHLVNKREIMDSAEKQVDADPRTFELAVARTILADSRASKLLRYEANPGIFKSWTAVSASSLADVIDRLRFWKQKSDNVFLNSFAKMVHDRLNASIGEPGNEVEVKAGSETFALSGDTTLGKSPASLAAAQAAVALSRQQILDVDPRGKKPNATALAAEVWKLVPSPTKRGKAAIDRMVVEMTNPRNPATVAAFANLIVSNLDTVIDKLVDKDLLRLPPPERAEPLPGGVAEPRDAGAELPGGVGEALDAGVGP